MSEVPLNQILEGDLFDVMDEVPDESVHAVVTDPPYGLAFMGKSWDDFEPKEYQEFSERWAREVKRVLKPGGHLLAFSGNRTHHRMFSGVEDAGFEVRDTLTWHYGSGFPKAADVSKTIDKRADAERETKRVEYNGSELMRHQAGDGSNTRPWMEEAEERGYHEVQGDEPATDAAKEWDGWKTGLKPATEFVVMARKPFDGATVDCVLEHRTGALNIGDCRIGVEKRENQPTAVNGGVYGDTTAGENVSETVEGRYPSNTMFDEVEAERLDRVEGGRRGGNGVGGESVDGRKALPDTIPNGVSSYDDYGGPSRYFYTSKASRRERTIDGVVENEHPTVKPIDLMRWLVRMVSREEQVVLDPFVGSGTTLLACEAEKRDWIGIDRDSDHVELARDRIAEFRNNPDAVIDDAEGKRNVQSKSEKPDWW